MSEIFWDTLNLSLDIWLLLKKGDQEYKISKQKKSCDVHTNQLFSHFLSCITTEITLGPAK